MYKIKLIALAILSSSVIISCSEPTEKKVEEAKENVVNANEELDAARADYQEDSEHYKQETAARIEANNKLIADIRVSAETAKKEMKADYQKQVNELEEKNEKLKVKMNEFKYESKAQWEQFKTEFNRDMDELGTALKNLTVDNKK